MLPVTTKAEFNKQVDTNSGLLPIVDANTVVIDANTADLDKRTNVNQKQELTITGLK